MLFYSILFIQLIPILAERILNVSIERVDWRRVAAGKGKDRREERSSPKAMTEGEIDVENWFSKWIDERKEEEEEGKESWFEKEWQNSEKGEEWTRLEGEVK